MALGLDGVIYAALLTLAALAPRAVAPCFHLVFKLSTFRAFLPCLYRLFSHIPYYSIIALVWTLPCSFKSETNVPRYPASAQNFQIDGNRSYAHFAVDMPPFVSWILATWTTTDNKHPSTSTTMCRFLPFVFSSVNSSCLAGYYRFHTLGINDRIAWTLLASGICSYLFYKMLQNFITKSAENHGVTVSIGTLNLQNTARHPSSRLGTTSFLFLPYLYFTTGLSFCEYSFLYVLPPCSLPFWYLIVYVLPERI